MKLIIDIPNEIFSDISKGYTCQEYADEIINLVKNGTPLPKGHGRLKDFEKLYTDMIESEKLARQRVIDSPTSPCYMRYVAQLNERTAFKEMLFDAPTIIEAERSDKE